MSSISWTYKEFWQWFGLIEEDKRKTEALRELNANDWLARLSADQQAHVFMYAPDEIVLSLKHFPKVIKYDTLLILQDARDKKNRRLKR